MTVLVVNLSSDGEGCTQLRKTPKMRRTACPTVRTPKRRHPASPTCEGDGSELADEDYLHLLDLQSTRDSDVYCLKKDKGVNPMADGVTDPHYKIFLKNLKLRGKSYALRIELEGNTVLLKYENEEMPCSRKAFGNMQDDFKKETLQCLSQKTGNGRYNADTFRNEDSVKQSNTRKKLSKEESDSIWRNIQVKQRKGVLRGKNAEVEEITTSAETKRRPAKEFDESARPRDMHDSAEDYVAWDGSILAFVQRLRKDGDFVVRTFDAGITMRYGEYEEEDGVPDVEIINREDFSSIGLNNPFVSAHSTDVVNIESMEGGKIPSCDNSEFRINLLQKLKEPYELKEYEDLMKMVTHKRHKEVNKELRGGRGVSYSTKDVCKSYIDIYEDFAKILKRVKGDRQRTLNLLRGFKYWLHLKSQCDDEVMITDIVEGSKAMELHLNRAILVKRLLPDYFQMILQRFGIPNDTRTHGVWLVVVPEIR